jgi:P4 family phage/plasmid primase-like protien
MTATGNSSVPAPGPLDTVARSYLTAGLCVLPAKLKAKRPSPPVWKPYQSRLPTEDELARWLANGAPEAVCLICGAVSGNLETLDFDCEAEVYGPWRELVEAEAPELVGRLVIEASQSGGRHVTYRLEGPVGGSTKLAEKVLIAPNGEPALYKGKEFVPRKVGDHYEFYPTLAETKGEGGLFLCAPSPGYVLEQGRFEDLPVVSAAEREIMVRCARSFNEKVEMIRSVSGPSPAGERPGDEFDQRGDIRPVLVKHGWTLAVQGDNEHWRRPGKKDSWSATFNGTVFYVFTSNADPFEADRGYGKFAVYALLEHGGDFKAAAKALAGQGYGRTHSGKAAPAGEPSTEGGQTSGRDGKSKKTGISTAAIAEDIVAQLHFATDVGGKLYIYRDGVYRPKGKQVIRRAVKRFYLGRALQDSWNSHRAEEVVEYIRVDAPSLWERPPLDVVNVRNGLLDVNSRELKPHSPAFLSPIQLPVAFDPDALCPAWEKFVQETFPSDAQAVALQIPAWLITPYTAIQKAILLIGDGANGKSTYLRAVVAMLGMGNVSGLSLHKLESDRFAVARLVGKLANVCPDLPSAHLAGTSVFKSLVGGDIMLAERKFVDSFEFVPFARLIFSANFPPRSEDASPGFFRRWLVLPFTRTFDPAEQIPPDVLDAKLADPQELSGVLNRALDALPGLRANGFSESESMRAAWQEFRQATDPLSVWLDANIIEDTAAFVSKDAVRAAYRADAEKSGKPSVSDKALSQAITNRWPQVKGGQRTYGGKERAHCWIGIGLRARMEDGE